MASSTTAPHPLHLLLPQLGTEEDFATLRETLRACGFHNEGICRRLEISSIVDFEPKCEGRKTAAEIEYPVDAIIRLVGAIQLRRPRRCVGPQPGAARTAVFHRHDVPR